MGKSAQTPAPVDYDKLIPLQTQANKDIFDYSLGQSRVNTVTPYGSTTWSKQTGAPDQAAYANALKTWQAQQKAGTAARREWVATGDDGIVGYNVNGPIYGGAGAGGYWRDVPGTSGTSTPMPRLEDFASEQWTQTQTLSPEQQKLFDAENASRLGLAGLTGDLTARAQQGLAKPPDLSGIPNYQTSFADADMSGIPQARTSFADADMSGIPQARTSFADADMSGLGALRGSFTDANLSPQIAQLQALDPMAFNQRLADALYSQGSRYLSDRVGQERMQLETRLAEQGFVPGTPGYEREMANLRKTQDMAYGDLTDRAIIAGQQGGSQIFNNQRGSINDQIAALLAGGSDARANAAAQNQAVAQDFSQRLARTADTRANAAAQLQGIQQQVSQLMAGQENTRANAAAGLQGIQQQVAQRLAEQANTRANAASANSGIQQQIARVLQEYNLPLATLNAVRTGAQPTIQNSGLQQTSVPGLSAVDLLGADQARYGQELDVYNAKVGQQNALMDVLGRIAGAWVGRP